MEETHIVAEVAKEAFHWGAFLEGSAVAVGTLLAGLVPLWQYWDKKRKAEQEEAAKKKAEELAKAPKYLEEKMFAQFRDQDFETFKSTNLAQHQELAATVERSAQQANDAVQELKTLGTTIKASLQENTIKTLENLALIREGISSSLGEAHEKANEAVKTSASLDGRVKALEEQQRRVAS